jgi:DNA modification methylase
LQSAFSNLRTIDGGLCTYFITAPQGGELGMMMMAMREAGLPVRHVLIWVKNNSTFSLNRLDYDYKHEPILLTWDKKHNFYGKGNQKTSVWKYDKPVTSKLHPTMKPIALITNALMNHSRKDDIVVDFFGGSGSTLIACEQMNRKCYMMEIDPHYCDVIITRWENFTKKIASKTQK